MKQRHAVIAKVIEKRNHCGEYLYKKWKASGRTNTVRIRASRRFRITCSTGLRHLSLYEYTCRQLQRRNLQLALNMNTFNKLWGGDATRSRRKLLNSVVLKTRAWKLRSRRFLLLGEDIYYGAHQGPYGETMGTFGYRITSIYHSPLASCYTYDNNYLNDTYLRDSDWWLYEDDWYMLGHENIEVELNADFFAKKDEYSSGIVVQKISLHGNDWWVLRLWTRHIRNTVRPFLKQKSWTWRTIKEMRVVNY